MQMRSVFQVGLWPWLLLGALLASVFVNVVQYSARDAGPNGASPSSTQLRNPDPGTIQSFHLTPGSSDEHCPTLDRLALTQEQRDRIRSCSLTSLDVRTDLAIEIAAASEQLDGLLQKDAIDSTHALELADRISGLRAQQYRAWIGSILVVREVLTSEQLRLLHELESN